MLAQKDKLFRGCRIFLTISSSCWDNSIGGRQGTGFICSFPPFRDIFLSEPFLPRSVDLSLLFLDSFLQGYLELCYSVSMSIRGYGPAFERPLPYNVLSADCPSRQVLDLIADKWTALIFALLEEQPTRYNELQRRIEGISQKMLTQTLRKLEANGIIKREITPTVPPAVEYALSALGETLIPVMVSLRHWAEQHLEEIEQVRHQPYSLG